MAITGVFPTVAGNFESSANSSCCKLHGFGAEEMKSAALTVVTKRAGNAVPVLQQRQDGVLHENVETKMNAMVLQGADHLQSGAIAHVRESRITMSAKIALQNPAVGGAIKKRAPSLEFTHARRRFLGMQLRHPPVIQVLTAAHGVGKVNAPAVPVVHVSHRRRYAAFGHHGVRFAEKRFRNDRDLYSSGRGFDGSAQAGATGSNDQNVVFMRDVLAH